MAELKASKVVSSLPATLEASTIYFVRVGSGFDLFVTNESGTVVAYSLNAPASGAFAGYVSSASTAITLTAGHHGQIIVLTATNPVGVTVPASGLPSNFYCRILCTNAAGWFRVVGASGVTLVSPTTGAFAIRQPYSTADVYAIGASTYLMDSLALTPAYLLNLVTSAAPLVAISTSRRISENHTGNLLDVRRSSDNTVQGIPQAGDLLNTTSLTNFVGSGSGFYRQVYDQTGNTKHFGQTTAANQPRVISSGVVETANNRVALRGLSTGTWMDSALTVTSSALTICLVGSLNASSANYARLASLGVTGSNDYDNVSSAAILDRNDSSTTIRSERNNTVYTGGTVVYGSLFSYVARWDGSFMTVFLNGVQVSKTAATGNFNASLLRVFAEPSGASFSYWDGNLCELIGFGSAITDAEITSLHNNWKTYYAIV